jgi:glutaryl-CoA dehydrogenase
MAHLKASFHWSDPLLLDHQLNDGERMVRESAASYSQERLAPRVLEAFRALTVPPQPSRPLNQRNAVQKNA